MRGIEDISLTNWVSILLGHTVYWDMIIGMQYNKFNNSNIDEAKKKNPWRKNEKIIILMTNLNVE